MDALPTTWAAFSTPGSNAITCPVGPTCRAASIVYQPMFAPMSYSTPPGASARRSSFSTRTSAARAGEVDRGGGRAWLPRDPDLQPVAADVEIVGLPRRGRGGVHGGDARQRDRRGADPRRVPGELRERGSGHQGEIARLARAFAARGGADRRVWRRAASGVGEDGGRAGGDRARRRDDPRRARRAP